jgi:hypothetical protein
MRFVPLIALAAGAFGLTATTPAVAFAPVPSALAATYNASAAKASPTAPLVAVKWKQRPPGWSRGRKVGWRGRGAPPGQLKKGRF